MTRRAEAWVLTAVLLAGVLAWTTAGSAQGQRGGGAAAQPASPPVRVQVQVVQVKPEAVGTYQDIIKSELVPALKKAGVAWRWTFANGPVGQGFTFVNVTPVANYAQFDQLPGALQRAIGADGVVKYNAKIRPTIVSTHTTVQTLRQDISILSNATTPPALVVVQDFQVAPGKGAEFTSAMTSDWIPAYKKAGVKDFWVYAVNFGAPGGLIGTVRPIAKYAELDEPGGLLGKAGLTPDQIQQMVARRAALASVVENTIVRYVPELSFGMPPVIPARGN